MNEIMLLFTIATIIYLPPTFVAVSNFLVHSTLSDDPLAWTDRVAKPLPRQSWDSICLEKSTQHSSGQSSARPRP